MTLSPAAGQLREEPPAQSPSTDRAAHGFDWERLVAFSLHPLKVAIIEALTWLRQPLSATELGKMVGSGRWSRDLVHYHAGCLEKWGVLAVTEVRRTQGGLESYYFFSEDAVGIFADQVSRL